MELILRLSTSEVIKMQYKNILLLLLRIVPIDNEENALIIFKILTDYIKAFKPSFFNEVKIYLMLLIIFFLDNCICYAVEKCISRNV